MRFGGSMVFFVVMIGVVIAFAIAAIFSTQPLHLALMWSAIAAVFPLSLSALILINIKGTLTTRLTDVLGQLEAYQTHLNAQREARTAKKGDEEDEYLSQLNHHIAKINAFPDQIRSKYKIDRYRGSFAFMTMVYAFLFFFMFNKILAISDFGALQTTLVAFPNEVIAAMFGAWAYALYSIISRISSADLSPEFLLRIGYQPILAIAVAYFSMFIFSNDFKLLLSFCIGFLPYPEIVKFLRGFLQKHLRKFTEGSTAGTSKPTAKPAPLSEIEGIEMDEVERLHEEGIKNIQQLAFSNPLAIHFSTSFPLKTILDWTDQALLRLYLSKEQIQALKPVGVRGSIEMAQILRRQREWKEESEAAIQNGKANVAPALKAQSDKLLADVTAALGVQPSNIEYLAYQLREDPQVEFIYFLYDDLSFST